MLMKKYNIFILLVTLQIAEDLNYILSSSLSNEDKVKRVKSFCYNQFPQFEKKLIDHLIDDLWKSGRI